MKINIERMEQSLEYLARTDEDYAKAKAHAEGLKETLKIVKSQLFLRMQGAQGERAEKAQAHPDYYAAVQKYQNAVLDVEYLRAKRTTETMHIECWRSLNAARNRGNI